MSNARDKLEDLIQETEIRQRRTKRLAKQAVDSYHIRQLLAELSWLDSLVESLKELEGLKWTKR